MTIKTNGSRDNGSILQTNFAASWFALARASYALAPLVYSCPVLAAEENPPAQDWHYGAYMDLSYAANFNSSDPHPWRSKATTNQLSEFSPNLGMFYLKKEASEASRWGFDIGGQAGYDTGGQVPNTQRLGGAEELQYVSRANVSYLAPVGSGLKFTGGLFSSFIGYESFYAKDNPNYTRSWIADYSPYFLIGLGAQYTFAEDIDTGFFLVTDYNYLGHVNSQPKYATQFTWRIAPDIKWMENLFFGPEQVQTSLDYWRFFANSMVEWAKPDYSVALVYDVGTERSAQAPGHVQNLWMGSALFSRWHVSGPWSVALRPELYWDPNGTLTGSIQFIKAVTSTLEYKFVESGFTNRLRLEYRYDNSTGRQGGFYGGGGENGPLVSGQSSIFFALMVSYDR
jgi:hypothetical protein